MSSDISAILAEMEVFAAKYNVPIINRESVPILREVTASANPKSVLEIGTAIGYSTLLLAANSTQNSKIITIELDEERINTAKNFLRQTGALYQIEIIQGDAGKIISELTGPFDLVFIDAAKGQYLDYLHKVMDKLSPRAVIIADNVLFRGWVLGDQVPPRRFRTIVKRLRAYLDFVRNDSRFTTVLYHVGDGIAVSHYQGETYI